MQRSLEICTDRRLCAQAYSELAFQTAARSGMWKRRPEPELVDGWIERALALADERSPAHVNALIAQAYWDPERSREAARAATELAETLGDIELLSYAWDASRLAAFRDGDYAEACAWAERRFEVVDRITDPDHVAGIYEGAIPAYAGGGSFARARELVALHESVAARLTPHHRLHGVAYRIQVEELAGEWEAIRALLGRTEEVVEANLATPCVLNPRSLLVSALAAAHLGEEAEARRLEARADELGMEGFGPILDGPRTQLLLLRGDLERVRALLVEPVAPRGRNWYFLAAMAARLDALAALGDRDRLEAEAAPHLRPGTYLGPFALRALGVIREDASLVEQAVARFDAMGLDWHAVRTRGLLG